MKIADFKKKGNVVRFYLTNDETEYWYGDDWNDYPYEHNAGCVYLEFVSGYIDIAFPFDCSLLEAKDDWRYNMNSPYCKDDMRERKVPCVLAVNETDPTVWSDDSFSYYIGYDSPITTKFYFGDKDYKEKALSAGGIILAEEELTYNEEKRESYTNDGKVFNG